MSSTRRIRMLGGEEAALVTKIDKRRISTIIMEMIV